MGVKLQAGVALRRIFGGGFGIFKTENTISQIALCVWKLFCICFGKN